MDQMEPRQRSLTAALFMQFLIKKLEVLLLRCGAPVGVAATVRLDVCGYLLPRDRQSVNILMGTDLLRLSVADKVNNTLLQKSTLSFNQLGNNCSEFHHLHLQASTLACARGLSCP